MQESWLFYIFTNTWCFCLFQLPLWWICIVSSLLFFCTCINGEVRVLLTATAPQPISLPSLATSCSFTPIMLSPFPLALCTSVSWVSFLVLERLCFLLSQGCGCPCLQWSPPSASSVLTAQLRNHLPVRAACPGSCPGQVLYHVSSMRAWFSFWLLSASHCALGLCGSILRAGTVHLCVSVFAVPVPDEVCCTNEAGCEGVLSSHYLCPSASMMPFFVYFLVCFLLFLSLDLVLELFKGRNCIAFIFLSPIHISIFIQNVNRRHTCNVHLYIICTLSIRQEVSLRLFQWLHIMIHRVPFFFL